MKLSQLYPTRFVSGKELPAEVHITIRQATFEDVRDPKTGETASRPVIYAMSAKRGILINKTNARELEKLFGDVEFDALTGKRITIYPCKHKSGKMMICIKDSPPLPPANGKATPPASQTKDAKDTQTQQATSTPPPPAPEHATVEAPPKAEPFQ